MKTGTRRSAARAKARKTRDSDPFAALHRGLVNAHGGLRAAATHILGAEDTSAPNGLVADFCSELLDHHKAEATFLFPAFRAAGRLRSSDVAFLDARDAEHVDVHRLCLELRDANRRHHRGALATRSWKTLVPSLLNEIVEISDPHFATEEATLTPRHLATLVTRRELAAMFRDMRANWQHR